MKKILVLASLLCMGKVRSQLTLQSGSNLTLTGNIQVTLKDIDLVNNSTLNLPTGSGNIIFAGTTNNSISGSGTTVFDKLEIAKASSGKLLLSQNISVNGSIHFTSGIIDLNKKNITLQPSALLTGESEASRIIGFMGGYVQITLPLNAPSAANPGNLGAVVTSSKNLGTTTIRRGHVIQTGSTAGSSIYRYYDILPANNTALNATLRFNYFDAELNGLTESSLNLWKSADNTTWTKIGATSNSTSSNYVEKKAITDFSRWSLFTGGSAMASNAPKYIEVKSPFENFEIKVFPNPVAEQFVISMPSSASTPLAIKIIDAKGATLFTQKNNLQQGANEIAVNIKSLPAGAYYLFMDWNNGQSVKTVKLVKQ